MGVSARVFSHRNKLILISFFDSVEIAKPVLDGRDVCRRSRGGDSHGLSVFAQAHFFRRRSGATATLAEFVFTLQNNCRESIWQHAVVVPTDERSVVAPCSHSDANPFHDPDISVELAQDRESILSLLQQAGSISVLWGIDRVCRVNRGAERDMIEK